MKFVKVKATPCNKEGQSRGNFSQRTFCLNIDLIGGIDNDSIMLKNGDIIRLGGFWFKDFHLVEKIDLNNL